MSQKTSVGAQQADGWVYPQCPDVHGRQASWHLVEVAPQEQVPLKHSSPPSQVPQLLPQASRPQTRKPQPQVAHAEPTHFWPEAQQVPLQGASPLGQGATQTPSVSQTSEEPQPPQ